MKLSSLILKKPLLHPEIIKYFAAVLRHLSRLYLQ